MRSIQFCLLCTCRVWLLFGIAAVALAQVPDAAPRERPNIVFIFSDDHAYQAISAYGSRINQTPSIDSLAHAGMRFDHCYVTNSICGPSRAAVLTGKYSHRNGVYVNGNTFDGDQPTFPRLLQAAGYQTALIGKWHLKSPPTGFDHYEVLVGQGPYYNPPMIRNGERVQHEGYTTEVITELTLTWLREQRQGNQPFLLMYQHKAPHRAWDPGPDQLTLYDDTIIPEPPTLFEDYGRRGTAVRQQDMSIAETLDARDLKLFTPPGLTEEQREGWEAAYGPKNRWFFAAQLTGQALTRWKYQRYIKDYLRCVAALDEQIGRVLTELDELGLTDNTIVVYASDQGFYLGEHGWFDKRWMYEQSLRTPLLVRWPGVVQPGAFCDEIVSNVDFAATFLDAAGADLPDDLDGRSLVPLLRGETPDDWRRSFYYHYYEYPAWHHVRRHYGVTDRRFKLIHFYEPDVNEWELYDLQFDPHELQNLYENPTYAGVRARLTDELARLRQELAVPEADPEASNRTFPDRTRIRALTLPR
jgi:arylsulfatase A-like enzyme